MVVAVVSIQQLVHLGINQIQITAKCYTLYLAVLYYTTGQNQMSIDHCTLVTRSRDHSRWSSDVLRSELLPKIDDDVHNMLGLADLYQGVLTAVLKQQLSLIHI